MIDPAVDAARNKSWSGLISTVRHGMAIIQSRRTPTPTSAWGFSPASKPCHCIIVLVLVLVILGSATSLIRWDDHVASSRHDGSVIGARYKHERALYELLKASSGNKVLVVTCMSQTHVTTNNAVSGNRNDGFSLGANVEYSSSCILRLINRPVQQFNMSARSACPVARHDRRYQQQKPGHGRR